MVYVDDIIVTGNDLAKIGLLKKFLTKKSKLKDLENLRYLLRNGGNKD